jgi:hypothetical protein
LAVWLPPSSPHPLCSGASYLPNALVPVPPLFPFLAAPSPFVFFFPFPAIFLSPPSFFCSGLLGLFVAFYGFVMQIRNILELFCTCERSHPCQRSIAELAPKCQKLLRKRSMDGDRSPDRSPICERSHSSLRSIAHGTLCYISAFSIIKLMLFNCFRSLRAL